MVEAAKSESRQPSRSGRTMLMPSSGLEVAPPDAPLPGGLLRMKERRASGAKVLEAL